MLGARLRELKTVLDLLNLFRCKVIRMNLRSNTSQRIHTNKWGKSMPSMSRVRNLQVGANQVSQRGGKASTYDVLVETRNL
jgi:hypothetical protein